MQIEFLLGPAGSGKTFQCLEGARRALEQAADGLPLVFIAPKQATYQLERQLLTPGAGSTTSLKQTKPLVDQLELFGGQTDLCGYTRLRIVSFERLARWIFTLAGRPEPRLLSEEGRVMVLRALLSRNHDRMKLFRASARAAGFAQQLSQLIRELQHSCCSSARLASLAHDPSTKGRLRDKLSDLSILFDAYQQWLKAEKLEDSERLVEMAAGLLDQSPDILFDTVWLDGFAQLNAQERRLLKAMAPRSQKMTLAFCVDPHATSDAWHTHWSIINRCVGELKEELQGLPGMRVEVKNIGRSPANKAPTGAAGSHAASAATRFAGQPELEHLEKYWESVKAYGNSRAKLKGVRLIECGNPEAEATFAAREILSHVQNGGRFRDSAVLVRQLENYHDILRRVFLRYEIPFFLDRREPIARHSLAELTRGALRALAFNWRQRDWFTALKSGLCPATENEIDNLENLALAKGWEGSAWQKPISVQNDPALAETIESLRRRLTKPFIELGRFLGNQPTGAQLCEGLRKFWTDLEVGQQLEDWTKNQTAPLHETAWRQLQEWAEMLSVAFKSHGQPLAVWIPIVESGLQGMSVGVVPPVLDQVLIGGVDRSRNPDLKEVFVLGLNEGVFPAPPRQPPILSDADWDSLNQAGVRISLSHREQIARERFFGYIACTRARQRVTLTYALRNADEEGLIPSSLVARVQRLFPSLKEPESFVVSKEWSDAAHLCEIVSPLLRARNHSDRPRGPDPTRQKSLSEREAISLVRSWPRLASILNRLEQARPGEPSLSPELANALYGPVHETSVSALEKLGQCPFWFFIESGLRAEERKRFKLDRRQEGTFQHKVLERFHLRIKEQGLTWHTVSVEQARREIERIADELLPGFEEGMLLSKPENEFMIQHQKAGLQRLVEILIGWMRQYEFEPTSVELTFGLGHSLPPWKVNAGNGRTLAVRGSIDRVDLFQPKDSEQIFYVVMDYKASGKKVDAVLMQHGIQLQLPAYLAALRNIDEANAFLGAKKLRPAGVFFVNLRGNYEGGANRDEVLGTKEAAHRMAYRHIGFFDSEALDYLDNRNADSGDQFKYKRKENGSLSLQVKGGKSPAELNQLIKQAEDRIEEFGRQIYEGKITIDPYKRGNEKPCGRCGHSSICRIDPWAHDFRILKKEISAEES